jgi:putative SOS response-associated peptidase YedK
MCGRYTHKFTWKQLHRLLGLTSSEMPLVPRFNVAPSQSAPVVRVEPDSNRTLAMLRWGLIPSWAKDPKIAYKTINARAETVATGPAFRAAFKAQRCVVPVSGFYEWSGTGEGGRKQPYYITPTDGEPMLLAGLWESWKHPDGEPLETFTIITTEPNEMMAKLHNRMPVILDPQDCARWLDADGRDAAALQGLLKPYPAELMMSHPVSTRLNTPKNDDPGLIDAIPELFG